MSEVKETMCHCGKPLHYSDENIKAQVDKIINEMGECVVIVSMSTGRSFEVPRHYIALHGVFAHQLEELGFKEVKSK